jgi:hypothetical protein
MADPYSGDRTGLPPWLKVTLLAVAVLVLAVAAVLLVGGHEPRPHGPAGDPGAVTPTSVADHTPPRHG